MLVLLPPSEGKTAARRGKPLDLETLSFPGLTATREQVLEALVALARRDPQQALAVLGLSPRQIDEVARDAILETAPTATAAAVYTGVLYEALDLATLDAPRRSAVRSVSVVVSSALFGALRARRPDPGVPALRRRRACPVWARCRRCGATRSPTAMAEAAGRGLVVDLRSGVVRRDVEADRATSRRAPSRCACCRRCPTAAARS